MVLLRNSTEFDILLLHRRHTGWDRTGQRSEMLGEQSRARSSKLLDRWQHDSIQRTVIDRPGWYPRRSKKSGELVCYTRDSPAEGRGCPRRGHSAAATPPASLFSHERRRGDPLDGVCSNGCHRVELPARGFYERDDSNARCNKERITDGFIPFSGRVRARYILH